MKKILLNTGFAIALACTVVACTKGTDTPAEGNTTEETAAAEYICPMKCEGEKTYKDKDTKCPVCKMDLQEKN